MHDESTDWVVLKFGGTSVSTRREWDTIVRLAREHLDDGARPFVVCSAVSGVTRTLKRLLEAALQDEHEPVLDEIRRTHLDLADALDVDGEALLDEYFEELEQLALGASLTKQINSPFRARVLGLGELMSTTLGAAYFEQQGLAADWQDARQILRAEHDPRAPERQRYLAATCHHEPDPALQQNLAGSDADLALTQGFIAGTESGETALLGWGGSDTSAAYFAAKLEAERLEIWTDVPGLFTANPREIPSARLLRQLDYEEAQELATTGAKVLHPRCIDPVQQAGIPLHVRSTQEPDLSGTVVTGGAATAGAQVKGIATRRDLTLVSMDTLGMWQEVGFLADAFAAFKEYDLSVDLVATSETNVTVSLDPATDDHPRPGVVDALVNDLKDFCDARAQAACASISLVGHNIRSVLHELGPALEVFDEQNVYLTTQASNDLNLTFVIDEAQVTRLLRELHAQLFDARGEDTLFGPTWRELHDEAERSPPVGPAWWKDRREDLLDAADESAPAFVYDERTLREAAHSARETLPAVDRMFYALKANAHPDVLRIFEEAGLGFECVSPGEIERVRSVFPDLDPDRILFTPNFAPREEYAFGLENAGVVTLDNMHPLEHWSDLFEDREVFLRLDPGRGRGHHEHVRTAGPEAKFGIAPDELDRCQELLQDAGATVVGLHAHLGSGIKRPRTWTETAVFLAEHAERFPAAHIVNVGGGLGVAERPGGVHLDLDDVNEHLARFRRAHPDLEVWMEPGRFLVASAGVLLARVTQKKRKEAVRYVGVETGMNSLIRPALYGGYHRIVNLSRLDDPPAQLAEVVGPICESGDVLGHSRRLPATEEGDVLLVANAGAYGRVMSSRYNLRDPAGEVMLRAEEEAESSEGCDRRLTDR
jgi:diaminopimelate decarboxylase/aspartate kinase